MVPETSVSSYNQLPRLIARGDFVVFSRRENFKSYNVATFDWGFPLFTLDTSEKCWEYLKTDCFVSTHN
jgi:hypothetical protein